MRLACAVALLLASPAVAAPAPATPAGGIVMLGTGLRASDLDRSLAFYTRGLGMKVGARLQHGSTTEVILSFGTPGQRAGILLLHDAAPGKSPPVARGDGFAKIVLQVPDLAALSARLRQAGYAAGEPRGSGGAKVVMIADPDGYPYELVQLPQPRP